MLGAMVHELILWKSVSIRLPASRIHLVLVSSHSHPNTSSQPINSHLLCPFSYSWAVFHSLFNTFLVFNPPLPFRQVDSSVEFTRTFISPNLTYLPFSPLTPHPQTATMRFSIAIITAFAASALAAPSADSKLRDLLKKRQSAFTQQSYDDISISGGVAGNAEQEALAVFSSLDMNNLAAATEADIDFLDSVNGICNDAEKEAFNPAIDAADGEEADALQRGKIKNKVLKLEATILRLMIEQAQGEDVADDMAAESKKLQNNISQDEDEAGNPSTFLSFDAQTD